MNWTSTEWQKNGTEEKKNPEGELMQFSEFGRNFCK